MMPNRVKLHTMDAYRLSTKQANSSIHLILTDPPYGIAVQPKEHYGNYPVDQSRLTIAKAPWDKEFNFSQDLAKQFYRALVDGGTLICWYDFWKIGELKATLSCVGFRAFRIIIWIKPNPIPVNSETHYLHNAKQYAIVCTKGHNPTFNSTYDNGVYRYPSQNRKSIGLEHPTQKSLALFKDLIRKHSTPDELIFDPFLGSGITALAAIEEGRSFIGGDISADYINALKQKIF